MMNVIFFLNIFHADNQLLNQLRFICAYNLRVNRGGKGLPSLLVLEVVFSAEHCYFFMSYLWTSCKMYLKATLNFRVQVLLTT